MNDRLPPRLFRKPWWRRSHDPRWSPMAPGTEVRDSSHADAGAKPWDTGVWSSPKFWGYHGYPLVNCPMNWKDPPCYFHGKLTISTGPFSSSRSVSHYQAGYISQVSLCFWIDFSILHTSTFSHLAMDQYLYIPFLVGWTSIYQLFWCSPGVQGFDPLPHLWCCLPTMGWSSETRQKPICDYRPRAGGPQAARCCGWVDQNANVVVRKATVRHG